jgi:hypothetical protein
MRRGCERSIGVSTLGGVVNETRGKKGASLEKGL